MVFSRSQQSSSLDYGSEILKGCQNEVGASCMFPLSQEVKDYLRRHNLIKIGSNSPEYILRNMYENAYLSGNVLNKNSDILLHNWHKDSEE